MKRDQIKITGELLWWSVTRLERNVAAAEFRASYAPFFRSTVFQSDNFTRNCRPIMLRGNWIDLVPALFPLLILNGRRSTIDSFPAGPLTTATSLLPLPLPLLVDEERRTSPRFRDKLRPPRCIKQTLLEYFTVECARYLLPVRRINKVDYLRGCTRGAAVAPRAVSMQKRTRHHPSNRSFSNSHFRSLYRGSKIESIGIDVSNVKNNYLLQTSSDSTFRIRTYVPRFRLSHTTRIISIERSSRGRRSKYSREKERKERKKARKHQVESRRAERRRMADRNEDFNWYPWSRALSLFLSLSGQRRLALFFSFFFSFSLLFLFASLFPIIPFPSSLSPRKRFTEAIPATVICTPANVRAELLTRSPYLR